MRIVRKLYIREFSKALAVVTLGLSLMLGSIDLIESLDKIKSKDILNLLDYLLHVLPKYIVYTMPMAGLFAGLFVTGLAMRNRETVAVMTAGGRLKGLFMPLVVAGVVLSFLNLALSEFVVPAAMRRVKAKTVETWGLYFKKGTVWLTAKDGSLARFSLYVKEDKTAREVNVFQFSQGMLSTRTDAEGATFRDGRWQMKNVKIYDFEKNTVTRHAELSMPAFVSPELLDKQLWQPAEMGIVELFHYTNRLKKAGIKNLKLEIDMHSRLSYPLVNLFMVLFAVSLSLRREMRGLASASVGVAVSLLYWLGYTASVSFGYAGMIPPVVSTWAPSAVFGAISFKLYHGIRE